MVTVVAVLAVAVAAGAIIQGSIGFGYALVAVPAMVLLLPWAVPVTPLFLALPMTLLMSAREWRSIDLSGFALITAGRLLGTAVGVVLLVDSGHLVRGGDRHVACGFRVGRQGRMAAHCLGSRIVAGTARWFVGQPVGRQASRRALVASDGVDVCSGRRGSDYPPGSWRLKPYHSLWRGFQPAAFSLLADPVSLLWGSRSCSGEAPAGAGRGTVW